MAKQSNSPNQGKYAYDDWVGQVRPDPRNIDPLTLMQGYIGQSSESGHIRVYSDESLNDFVEVPEDAIVHAQQLSPSESSLGGSKLWLRSDAVIVYGDPKSVNRPRTTFLEGDLMQQYGAFGNFAQPFRPIASVRCPTVNPVICNPQTRVCPQGAGGWSNQPTENGMCTMATECGQYITIAGPNCPALSTEAGICPPYMGDAGGQFMATFPAIQCGPPVSALVANCTIIRSAPVANCPVSIPFVRCPIASFVRTRCSWNTCFQTICGLQTRLPICGGIPCQFGSVTVPITTTRTILTETITGPTGPGGTIIQPGGFMGQPDTTMMGGYYGTFNPYMM
ncbi:hypothetical protein [Spirosoma arcticum]